MWLAHGWLALSAAFAPEPLRLGRGGSGDVEPRTWRSNSGEFELFVDPSTRSGAGPGRYRLSRAGAALWTVTQPFTLTNVAVTSDGTTLGYGYTRGVFTRWDELGELVIAVLAPDGKLRQRHDVARTPSGFEHGSPDPNVSGLLVLDGADRCFVRVRDADVNRASEAWWAYRMSTGAEIAKLTPRDHQTGLPERAFLVGALVVPGLPLVIVQWFRSGSDDRNYGARFALLDEQARGVWMLDLPGDYVRETEDGTSWALQLMRERDQGAILSAVEPSRFELWLAKDAQRVTYEVSGGPASGWIVREIARAPFDGVEPPDASTRGALAPSPSNAVESEPARELPALGDIDLTRNDAPLPPIGHVGAFEFDSGGNVVVLDGRAKSPHALVWIDPTGRVLAEHLLHFEAGPGGQIVGDFAVLPGERVLCGWESWGGAHRPAARLHTVALRTGAHERVTADLGTDIHDIASSADGRFFVLGDNQLDAFDASGAHEWTRRSSDKLCGARAIAVSHDGRIVALDGDGLQWIGSNGKIGRYRKLTDLWKGERSYTSSLAADRDGGLVSAKDGRLILMDAEGAQRGELLPRFASGARVELHDPTRTSPDGTRWVTDREALYALDASGVVTRAIGESADVEVLREVSSVFLDDADRIHACSKRTGRVFVVDFELDPQHTIAAGASAPRARFAEQDPRVAGTAGRKPSVGTSALAQPGTGRFWEFGRDGVWLVAADGQVVHKTERKPDGSWLHPAGPMVARDGSLVVWDDGAVVFGADGTLREHIALDEGSHSRAFDGSRIVSLAGEILTVRWLAEARVERYRLAGVRGEEARRWDALLPRTRDEIWFFDDVHTVRRFALARE